GLGDAHQDGTAGGGLPALGHDGPVGLLEDRPLDQVARQQLGVARLEDVHPLQHLADDDLDVLVVDRHALRPVDLLDLLDQVELHGAGAEDAQHLVRVDGARDELLADVDVLALLDQETRPHRHRVGDLVGAVVGDDDDLPRLLRLVDLDGAGDLADRGPALGVAGVEQILDARLSVGEVAAVLTTGVEGAHRQLRARLTDGLRGDDADGLTGGHPLAGGQRTAVAGGADTDLGLADQGAAGADPLHAGLGQTLHDRFGQVGVGREDDRPVDDAVLGYRAAD